MRPSTLLLTFLSVLGSHLLVAQKNYFQQQVDYEIRVQLDDSLHRLTSFATIDYTNHAPDTLSFIWFHIWPNAYKTERSALGKQLLENGNTSFYFSTPEQKGYINRLDFRVNGMTATIEDHPQHLDIIKLILPTPLPPHKTIRITTPFSVQLPEIFSRSGHHEKTYQVTQWYPKPAVYDRDGWHPMPYLDQGEFYSEFGNYTLTITLPEEYVVAASGQLMDTSERIKLLSLGLEGNRGITKALLDRGGNRLFKTLHYRADSVHDVAWFASPNYQIQFDTCRLKDGSTKEIWHFLMPGSGNTWKNSIQYSKEALRYYSHRIGTYPYPTLSVVGSAKGPGGGMEYPMLSVIDPTTDTIELRTIIQHEIGHNWFYGTLATNERVNPWMDEGLNTYYERRLAITPSDKTAELLLEHLYQEKQDQPINTPAEQFTQLNYGAVAYLKAAKWMEHIEKMLGRERFDEAMRDYYNTWKFKHPNPQDLLDRFQKHSQGDLQYSFKLLTKTGPLQPAPKHGWKMQGIKQWILNSRPSIKNRITAFPSIGFNQPDGLQFGVGITNIKIPLNDLQWLAIPMFATGSKKLNYLGFLNHRWRPTGTWKRIDLGLAFSNFSFNRFKAPNGQNLTLRFAKLAPGIRFTWREQPRSSRNRSVQLTYFHLIETGFRLQRDTIINPGIDTVINSFYQRQNNTRGLVQLRYTHEDNRKLYPYRWEAQIQSNGQFVRPSVTLTQFFNYPKKGGLHLRVFAGGFLYTNNFSQSQRYRQSRYYLQMSGATGEQDYTYSHYFLGRSAYEGLFAQQILERDGAFKIRTDRLSSPVGRSDNWLLALNLSSSIPEQWNPLNVLPIKIPLHVFLDMGASGSTWAPENEGPRWIYNAGLEVSMLKRSIRMFIPFLYSKPYREYVRSILDAKNRFFKKISFQIDLSNLHPRRIEPEIDLW